MPLRRKSRRRISESLHWTCTLDITLTAFLFLGLAAYSPAQLLKSPTPPPAKAGPTTPTDPLGRETPRGAVMGLLISGEHDDYETAARYLQPTPGLNTNLAQRAEEFQALHTKFKGSIDLLSQDPNGTIDPGLPPGQVRAGVLVVGSMTVDVILVRVDDPEAGKIWLVSKETVASIPELYAQMESAAPTIVDQVMPAALGRLRRPQGGDRLRQRRGVQGGSGRARGIGRSAVARHTDVHDAERGNTCLLRSGRA